MVMRETFHLQQNKQFSVDYKLHHASHGSINFMNFSLSAVFICAKIYSKIEILTALYIEHCEIQHRSEFSEIFILFSFYSFE